MLPGTRPLGHLSPTNPYPTLVSLTLLPLSFPQHPSIPAHPNTAPEIVQLYAINFPASAIRAKVRQEFERNALVDDLETVDVLLLKGHQEYQEVRSRSG